MKINCTILRLMKSFCLVMLMMLLTVFFKYHQTVLSDFTTVKWMSDDDTQIRYTDSTDYVSNIISTLPVPAVSKPTNNNSNNVYEKRRETLLKMCSKLQDRRTGYGGIFSKKLNILINRNQGLAYCPILKAGSTFWRNVFKVLTGSSTRSNPFQPGRSLGKDEFLSDFQKIRDANTFMNESTTIIIARDPYSRLFSGYVDKLFSPNTLFWRHIGRYAIKLSRPNASETALRCGHDLTFREMVKYVIQAQRNGTKRSEHFTPQYSHCHPCHYKYDIIGKFESIKEDTFYILNKFNKSYLNLSLEREFRKHQYSLTIADQTKWLYFFRSSFKNCISFYNAQRRMWKKFQIRGFVSKKSKYPVTKMESGTLTKSQFQNILKGGIGDAKDWEVAKKNKEEAMTEAYSSVDREDLEKLREIFQPDCDLFGYDCKPDNIFNQTSKIEPWYFDISNA